MFPYSDYYFLQVNAPCYFLGLTKTGLGETGLEVFDMPGSSPDLNLIKPAQFYLLWWWEAWGVIIRHSKNNNSYQPLRNLHCYFLNYSSSDRDNLTTKVPLHGYTSFSRFGCWGDVLKHWTEVTGWRRGYNAKERREDQAPTPIFVL